MFVKGLNFSPYQHHFYNFLQFLRTRGCCVIIRLTATSSNTSFIGELAIKLALKSISYTYFIEIPLLNRKVWPFHEVDR